MPSSVPVEHETLPALLAARAEAHPDRIALVGNDGTGDYRGLTYRELHDLAGRVAALIQSSVADRMTGPPRIAWVYGNDAPLTAIVLFHAVAALGAVAVPVNPASTIPEIEEILERAAVSLVVAPRSTGLSAAAGIPALVEIDAYDELVAMAADREPVSGRVSATAPAVVLFTSGTTGRSKGVVHSQRSALAAGRGWSEAFRLQPDDVYQSTFPVYAGAGLHFNGIACLVAGCTYVIDEPRPTESSLRRIERYRATVYGAVPSIYLYWLSHDLGAYDLSSLRLLDFGGAVMHRSTIESLRAALPAVELIQSYGLTEAGPGGLYLPPDRLDAHLGSIGCIGSGGLRFRVVAEPEAPSGLTDTVGELQFAGESLMLGYLDDPVSTDAVFDGEWMRTGDLVRLDEDGYVFFLDRMKDLIIRGGFNISSIEVEEAIVAHPAVRQAAVFGMPHERLGEIVAVAVVAEDAASLDLDDLRAYASERLARVKVPERIVVVDALPMSAAGKVLKAQLRSLAGLREWR